MHRSTLFFALIACAGAGSSSAQVAASISSTRHVLLPLAFERQGEGPQASFVARGKGYGIALQGSNARITVQGSPDVRPAAISMRFAGGRLAAGVADRELPGRVNYLLGRDPGLWKLGLPTYGRVTYREIYPGIDVAYYGDQQGLEFDLLLRAGADPRRIRLQFGGAARVALDADGVLVVGTREGDIRLPLPAVYQVSRGVKAPVKCHYALLADHQVGFRVEAYDRTRTLVIDPTIVYSGLIGGGTGYAYGQAIARSSGGTLYVAGYTTATDLPGANLSPAPFRGNTEGFVSKLDSTGAATLYTTYIGGGGADTLTSIAVDSAGAAWVTGNTSSVDFPIAGGFQSVLGANGSAVVAKLGPTGTLAYSTYLGSNSYGKGIAVDTAGSAYVTGYVAGGGSIATTAGAFLTASQGSEDAFAGKFTAGGSLAYLTYLGGTGSDFGNGIAVDTGGSAYVAGYSSSSAFTGAPAGGAHTYAGNGDAFVVKLNPAGAALSYFTFLGGGGRDAANAIAVDASGNAYLAGDTASTDFPVSPGVLQSTFSGIADGFVAKLNATGSAILYATYLGGNRSQSISSLTVDGSGNVYVTGNTTSDQFPVSGAVQGSMPGKSTSLFRTTDSGTSWAAFDGNMGGAVFAVLPDPLTSGVIVAAAEANVLRSIDGGGSWTRTYGWSIPSLSRSPANSGTIYGVSGSPGSPPISSLNGGATWGALSPVGAAVENVVADPLNANTAYAFSTSGSAVVYKTADGGTTWNPANSGLPPGPVYSLVAGSDGSLYADIYSYGVYKSTNQGGAWNFLNVGGTASAVINGLAISPSNPSVLYKAISSGGIYKTTNAGLAWTNLANLPASFGGGLAVSPADPSVVYAIRSTNVAPTVFRSIDGGTTWNPAAAGLGTTPPSRIVFDPRDVTAAYAISAVNTAGFVSKINSTGTSLLYSTYLGGYGSAAGMGIAAGGSGDVFVTGSAGPAGFPVTTGPIYGSSPQGFLVHMTDATSACTSSYPVIAPAQVIYSAARTLDYTVVAPGSCPWTAVSDQLWAAVASGAAGSGTGVVEVSAAVNATGAVRTANLTIGGQAFSVTQAQSSCSYSLDPRSGVSVPAAGAAVRVDVGTPAGCPWSVAGGLPNGVTVTSGASGNGNGTVMLAVGPSPAQAPRTLALSIANTSFVITQSGACTYSLSPASAWFGGSGGASSVSVITQAGCSWTASGTSWLAITSGGAGNGSGTVSFNVAANSGASRSSGISIGGQSFPVMQTGTTALLISTVAGGAPPATAATGLSVSVPVSYGIVHDGAGNLYFSAPALNVVFKLAANGILTRVAGNGTAGYSGDGGRAISAQLGLPYGLALDSAGNLYILEYGNNSIRKVTPGGTISTVAGGGALSTAYGMAADTLGNVFFADYSRVRKLALDGTMTTVAGFGATGYSGDNGPATSAKIYATGVAVDLSGNVYIAESNNHRVRMVSPGGTITTVAGNGVSGNSGDNGAATSAKLASPDALAVDASGNLYIADSDFSVVRKVAAGTGIITTVAGTGTEGFSGDGGPAASARLSGPNALAVDAAGNLYVADSGNGRLRKVSPTGTITTIAGGGFSNATTVGPIASLGQPGAVVKDSTGNLYIVDTGFHRILKLAANGVISTFAGTGTAGFSGDGGQAAAAQLNSPSGLALDSAGSPYIADTNNNRIRKVTANGTIVTIAGTGVAGFSGDGGNATLAKLQHPRGIVSDSGNLYFADTDNNRVRKIAADGTITTVAGSGTYGFAGDNGPATSAQLENPYSVALDSAHNLYIADMQNCRIRKVTPGNVISTFAGTGTCTFSGDGGPAAGAGLYYPVAVSVDTQGNLYSLDSAIGRVRQVTPSGIITTVAGGGALGYPGDGVPALSVALQGPGGMALDGSNIYVADTFANAIRLLTPIQTQPVLTISSTHAGDFNPGQTGAYTLTAANAPMAGPASGTVTVTEILPAGLTMSALSGSGWSCTVSTSSCTRDATLTGGSSYPPITATVSVAADVPVQVTNQATVSGGGAAMTGAQDVTGMTGPAAAVLVSPANSAAGVSLTPTLTWNAATGAASYDVYFGTSATPPLVANTNGTSYAPNALSPSGTYYWAIAARNNAGTASSGVWSFTANCVSALNPSSVSIGAAATTGSVPLTAPNGCGWSAQSNDSWLTITSGSTGSGNGTVNYSVAQNLGAARVGTLTVATQMFTVTQASPVSAALRFVSITPCRVVDTRTAAGSFGGPAISGGASRDFIIANGACGVPASAQGFSLNVTVVPPGALGYLTLWPSGQTRPAVSTVNSDGRFKSNAAIVPAGTGGAVSVYASDTTHVILDINGYFVSATDPTALAFYPIAPCRIADTRTANGPLGGPSLTGGATRTFPILGTCNLPASAQAYSLNFAAVPGGHSLGYVTAWPTGQPKPGVSSLSAPTGTVVANAAIVKAGTNGSIDIFASDATHFVIDVNGYFAPVGAGGLSLYGITPCRVVDTRRPVGSLPISNLDVGVSASACGIPANAQAHVMAVTVVPPASMGYLTMWPQGQARPAVSTLNALDGAVTSNLAIVPTLNGWISAYASNPTHLVLDISGYFAQ